MQKNIEKGCMEINKYKSDIYFFNSAREGFAEVLRELRKKYKDYILLIPGYIGYSPNEGSGIYDPIVENNIKHKFYKLDLNLNIFMEDYKNKIESIKNEKIVLLIVNYFGYVDKNIKDVIDLARKKDAIIIEDSAHSLYTDYVDNNCGIYSDISIYSLHKMLPVSIGGMIRINDNIIYDIKNNVNNIINPFEYNFNKIAKKRKENAILIEQGIMDIKGIELLRPIKYNKNITPQTYPIIIKDYNKDELYHKLNNKGIGVVSLYHTMINVLQSDEYKEANYISKHILNLPVHQDIEKEQINYMCEQLQKLCEEKNEKI